MQEHESMTSTSVRNISHLSRNLAYQRECEVQFFGSTTIPSHIFCESLLFPFRESSKINLSKEN